MADAMNNLRAAGIAPVVSSGNNGVTNGISWPACLSSAISVGAIDETSGTADDGIVTGGDLLTVNFNANATNARVQTLVRAVSYRTTSETPGASDRTITFTVADKNSGSANDTSTVSVTPQLDLIISEIMYNPGASGDTPWEWVEVYNQETTSVNLAISCSLFLF